MAHRISSRRFAQPLDRWASLLMLGLLAVIAAVLLLGDHATARIRNFSWHERQVGAEDIAFMLNFSRPMDTASVEANLTISPDLPGKISWAGRRMAYTLEMPPLYGQQFQIRLDHAQERYAGDRDSFFESFESSFQSRHRAFAYIGAEANEAQRLVLVDMTQGSRRILTPQNLVVLNFAPYPLGDRILISAVDRDAYQTGSLAAQLYTVTTGLNVNPPDDFGVAQSFSLSRLWKRSPKTTPPGELSLLLDNQGYQNLKFDLSPDGKTIVVQRVNLEDLADFGPWIVRDGEAQRLDTEPGGDFLIAPDSQSLVMLQGQGVAIIPLDTTEPEGATQPLDFLPEYGQVFDLKSNGTAAAMVNFNQNNPEQRYTESLFLVDNQGNETELLQVSGAVMDAQFDPSNTLLYTLTSEVIPGNTYLEQPMLSAINLETLAMTELLPLPPQPNLNMSLSPDGLALLLNLREETAGDSNSTVGEADRILLLPLFATTQERLNREPTPLSPELLPTRGMRVTWLP